MKRKEFIKNVGLVGAGTLAGPLLFPSATKLFSTPRSGNADFVVYVMFAGGVRQQESVLQRYLTDSQNISGSGYEGNIMPNLLNGALPTNKIVFGTDQPGGLKGSLPIPKILSTTLQQQGVLFPEVKAAGVGHYTGLCTLLTGTSIVNQGLRQRPSYPTIFEYARKFLNLPASQTWFVGNGIGNSVPLLNYSSHPDFGLKYGANFIAPNVTFGTEGRNQIGDVKSYHPEEELGPVYQMKAFLDQNFGLEATEYGGIENNKDEKHDIKKFFEEMFRKKQLGIIANPPVADNGDMTTIGYACEVLKWFKPKVLVLNLNNVDTCHGNFTSYLAALHRADQAVGHLWNFIQTQIPDMAGRTFMMVSPEHGRNLEPNTVLDENNWKAYDHSDLNTTRIFSMMVGPGVPNNLVVGSESNPVGDISDGILTLAEALGIKQQVVNEGLVSGNSRSLFDRI